MTILIQTLLDITFLRKGPEHIPPSWFLFGVTVVLRTVALVLLVVAIDHFSEQPAALDMQQSIMGDLIVWLIGLGCFGGVLLVANKRERLAQTMTALVGIGAIVTFAVLLATVVGSVLFAGRPIIIVWQLLLLWSVVVKGHIMARATGWHWYAGLLISLGVLLLQLFVGPKL